MTNLPFSEFLTHLTRQGFILGVDQYLRLQTVLNSLGPDCPPAELKYLLCPLFATNAKQQQQFYHAFDAYFAAFEPERAAQAKAAAAEQPRAAAPSEPLPIKSWQYVLCGVVWVLLIALVSYQWQYGPLRWPFDKLRANGTLFSTPTPAPAGTPRPTPKPAGTPAAAPTPPLLQGQPPVQPNWLKIFYQTYWFPLRWVGILTPLIIFGLTEWYRWNRRKLVLEKRRGKKPPLVWPVRVDAPDPAFLKDARLYTAARLLRRRRQSEVYQLDIGQTIAAAMRSGGFPRFCYRPLTKPPEYLVLIDLPACRDHFAYFADSLVGALEREGLFVARYFYEQNPRICFRAVNREREYLADLAGKYQDHRLLIFGGGESLLDPVSGELDAWTVLFRKWRDRAFLTIVPPAEWGLREVALARDFIVLPAALDGLAALGGHFEYAAPGVDIGVAAGVETPVSIPLPFQGKAGGSARRSRDGIKAGVSTPDGIAPGVSTPDLRAALGGDVFQWLCACAVYPELHWELTLYLGALPCMPANLLTEANVLRLIRLPWFREGVLPDELRWQLLGELDAPKSQAIRAALIELLEQHPPPAESVAHDAYTLNLVVQRWLLSAKARKQRRELRQTLHDARDARTVQDYTLVRFLEGAPASPLSLVLPKRLRKLFYQRGVPLFGLKSSVRAAFAALALLAAAFLVQPPQEWIEPRTGMEFVWINGGCFMMGSPASEEGRYDNESPVHKVCINGFYLGKYEVTQAQWQKIRGNNPSSFQGDTRPVERVPWDDVQEFMKKLNGPVETGRRPVSTGVFRLPTEAEWEYAARAGTQTVYSFGDDANTLGEYAWYFENSGNQTHPVGQKTPNVWGLYDIYGNVYEWCQDWYDGAYYMKSPADNPQGPASGSDRVFRGGGWYYDAVYGRAAGRYHDAPYYSYRYVGFRLLRTPG